MQLEPQKKTQRENMRNTSVRPQARARGIDLAAYDVREVSDFDGKFEAPRIQAQHRLRGVVLGVPMRGGILYRGIN